MILKQQPPTQQEWFDQWFNSNYYTRVYSHRSHSEAQNVIDLLLRLVPLAKESTVLDLCCGNGRHSHALAERGLSVVGMDISPTLLDIARSSNAHNAVSFYQGDMREPYPEAPFDCIANFFTSFGYFDDDNDNLLVLQRVREALKPNGTFFFDYLNAPYTQRTLVPHDSKVVENLSVRQTRHIDERFVVKTIDIGDKDGTRHTFTERVRLFTNNDFERMFARAGLRINAVYGSYTGQAYTENSPRLILVATVAS